MSSIQTGIVLQDNFSNVAQGVVESMYNMAATAYEASQAVSSNVDTSSIQQKKLIKQLLLWMNLMQQQVDQQHQVLHSLLWMGETVR